ncbi:PASTA domain-containing protein [Rhodococcus sp. OK302]|uniref:PASTA domain-containing protein n=1 Tax=Rhodococcus sp. OK302 TaxID=1882769 RepID=UPI000B9F6A27|nr:PASTA domain-containing protein [Rhodococcus sp. OK302]OYD70956.1 PASTA domain-containing protein [Rhodococcus sp. OK302]
MTYPPQNPNEHQQPYGQQPQFQAPIQPKPKKKWPWIVGGVVVLLVIVGMVGGGDKDKEDKAAATVTTSVAVAPLAPKATTTKAAAPTTTTVEPVVVAEVTLPDVAGQNGAIVLDKLKKLGLTNVTTASADLKDTVVLLAANWTVVSIEPAPGTIVAGDDLVVVTMTKQ